MQVCEGRAFQVEVSASAKALKVLATLAGELKDQKRKQRQKEPFGAAVGAQEKAKFFTFHME